MAWRRPYCHCYECQASREEDVLRRRVEHWLAWKRYAERTSRLNSGVAVAPHSTPKIYREQQHLSPHR